jgi:hypothetical protein
LEFEANPAKGRGIQHLADKALKGLSFLGGCLQ